MTQNSSHSNNPVSHFSEILLFFSRHQFFSTCDARFWYGCLHYSKVDCSRNGLFISAHKSEAKCGSNGSFLMSCKVQNNDLGDFFTKVTMWFCIFPCKVINVSCIGFDTAETSIFILILQNYIKYRAIILLYSKITPYIFLFFIFVNIVIHILPHLFPITK